MAKLSAKGRQFDVDLIVFDKDGTLIELDFLWSQQIEKWGRLLQTKLSLTLSQLHAIYEQMGYDWQQKRLLPDTPAAVASVDQFQTIASFLLYKNGITWSVAEQAVQRAARVSISALPESHMLRPIGRVYETLLRLQQEGVAMALLTSDDRPPTEHALRLLGWTQFFEVVVCANDGLAKKPAPDALLFISKQSGVPSARMLMVGDSQGDIACGRSAGVAGCICVGDGGAAAVADATIESIEEILLA